MGCLVYGCSRECEKDENGKRKRKRKRKRKPIASGMSCVRVSVGHAVGARLHGGENKVPIEDDVCRQNTGGAVRWTRRGREICMQGLAAVGMCEKFDCR